MEGPSTHRRELYFRERQEYQGCRNMKRGENLKSWDRDHKLHFWSLSSGSRGLITGARSSSFFLSLRFMKYPGILPNFFFTLGILSGFGPYEQMGSNQALWPLYGNTGIGACMNFFLWIAIGMSDLTGESVPCRLLASASQWSWHGIKGISWKHNFQLYFITFERVNYLCSTNILCRPQSQMWARG